eukprot:4060528-Ditylum_brightwellii.AAC.1
MKSITKKKTSEVADETSKAYIMSLSHNEDVKKAIRPAMAVKKEQNSMKLAGSVLYAAPKSQ